MNAASSKPIRFRHGSGRQAGRPRQQLPRQQEHASASSMNTL